MANHLLIVLFLSISQIFIIQFPCFAWFNRGLDTTIAEMQKLFTKSELIELYDNYVHPDIKSDIIKLIDYMKTEKTDEGKIAARLKYKNVTEYQNASSRDVIIRLFDLMKQSQYRQPSKINNTAYLRLALSLSLLFAFLDNGMECIDRQVGFKCAILTYKGNNFTMKIYFYHQSGKWFLTDGRHCM